MGAVGKWRLRAGEHPQVHLVYQSRGLQRVIGTLLSKVSSGDAPQFDINRLHELIGGAGIAVANSVQQLRDWCVQRASPGRIMTCGLKRKVEGLKEAVDQAYGAQLRTIDSLRPWARPVYLSDNDLMDVVETLLTCVLLKFRLANFDPLVRRNDSELPGVNAQGLPNKPYVG
jgi:hypothetical protein